jgi:hypothetical protein
MSVLEGSLENNGGGGGGAVNSVFGRTDVVVAENGDYTASQITNVPAGNVSATNVQDAIDELAASRFFAIVDYVGTAPGTYATYKDAIDAGESRIEITAGGSEVADSTLSKATIIYVRSGVTVFPKRINVASTVNFLTIVGENRLFSSFQYNPSAIDQPFIYGAGTLVQFQNAKFWNISSFANTTLFEDGPLQLTDSIILSGNADNTGVNFQGNVNSYSNNNIFSATSANGTNTFKASYGTHSNNYFDNGIGGGLTGTFATISSGVSLENTQYQGLMNITSGGRIGNFYPDYNGLIDSSNITNTSALTVYDNIDLISGNFTTGAFASGQVSALRSSGQIITNASANGWNWLNISGAPDMQVLGDNNIIIGSGLDSFTIDASAIGTIISGSSAASYTNNGTGTKRSGNNSTIGNDYDPTTGTHNTTWQGPFTTPVTGNIPYQLLNGEVTLALPAVSGAATISGQKITNTTVLPANLRPSTSQYFTLLTTDSSVNAIGIAYVQTSGVIEIWPNSNGNNFTIGFSPGFYATTLKYKL